MRIINKIKPQPFSIFKYLSIFAATNGELAQLARAFEWHSKGRRFDSDILHKHHPKH